MLKHFSIKKKLTLLTMLVCGTSLILGTAGLLLQEVRTFRANALNDLSTQARLFAGLSAAALTFNDSGTATDMLAELKNRPHVLLAVIYQQGSVFASYRRPDCQWEQPSEVPAMDGHQFAVKHITLWRAIELKGERLGTVYLVADTGDFSTRMQQAVLILFSVFVASTVLALLLASRLQRVIAEPIQHLSTTASQIARSQNYSLRAVKHGDDELGRLTDVFNQMLERIQAQDEELKKSQERYELAVLGSSDGLWDLDLSRMIAYYSPRCKTMLGYHASEPLDDQAAWQALTHPDDAARVDAVFVDCWTGARSSFDVEFRARGSDGSYRWILVRGAVLRDSTGAPLRIAGSHTDINERKLSEAALLVTSRQAGMAEIATGVLHNVGNVLNSVNVSATLLVDRMRRSKLGNLAKGIGLLREHETDLAHYVSTDPKGRMVIGYLSNLVEHLQTEGDANLEELGSLATNVDHIKQIVAMQQSYARVAGVMESVPADSLIDDALRVVATTFERSGIQVTRDIPASLPVFVDKHKVLQVLVNIFTNARQSLDEANPPEKQVRIEIHPHDPNKVAIVIRDNGLGIEPENLTRIFQHGFTTKKEGHGFGLHSGANALKEIGGAISASSEGPRRGAAFTILLPVQSEPAARAA